MQQRKTYLKQLLAWATILTLAISSCQKSLLTEAAKQAESIAMLAGENGHLKQAKTYNSDVAIAWIDLQKRMHQVPLPAGATGLSNAARSSAYLGLALYEAVVPGMPAYQSLGGQLNQLGEMPKTQPGKAYYWPASANAALAAVSRYLHVLQSPANKAAIDDLESNLNADYASKTDAATLQRSNDFGKAVAAAIIAWAASDGWLTTPPPGSYVIQVGPGLWEKVPPQNAGPVLPFAHMHRPLVAGSYSNVNAAVPPPYNTTIGSPFWNMVDEVYQTSLTLTPDQTAQAIYHRDAPGYPGGGHQLVALAEIFSQYQPTLDQSALAFCKAGVAWADAISLTFIMKYTQLTIRPATYIRNVMGHAAWNPTIPTPGHPEWPSAHATQGGVIRVMLTQVLGDNRPFSLNTYQYLGLPARNYGSLNDWAYEGAQSRIYGGIHYSVSRDAGLYVGEKVAQNINQKIQFLKP